MPNNVYIGSRYVPIFDGDWSNTKTYEALTIVNYNGGSYTSKRTVPAGTLPTNTSYWALTGNYNGQIASLQNQIGDLTQLHTKDKTSLVKAINSGIKRRWIFIGDSWNTTDTPTGGVPITPWSPALRALLGITAAGTYYEVGNSGSGFSAGTKFQSLLQNLSVTDKNSITDIVVLGGVNDVGHTANLYSDITAFKNYCKTNYPNAMITIGMVSWNTSYTVNESLRSVYGYYITAASENCRVIPYPFAAVHNYSYYQPDGGHLNATGTNRLVQQLAPYFTGRNAAYWDTDDSIAVTITGSQFASLTSYLYAGLIDNQIYAKFTEGRLTMNTGTTLAPLTWYKIGNIAKKLICGGNDGETLFMGHAWGFDGTNYLNLDIEIHIRGFEMFFRILTVNSGGVTPQAIQFIEIPLMAEVFSIFNT